MIMMINSKSEEPIILDGTTVQEVTKFVYLGSKITGDGDPMTDILALISKATGKFAALPNI